MPFKPLFIFHGAPGKADLCTGPSAMSLLTAGCHVVGCGSTDTTSPTHLYLLVFLLFAMQKLYSQPAVLQKEVLCV